MKFTRQRVILFVAIAIVIVILSSMQRSSRKQSGDVDYIVYGTDWCGYTVKQLKYLDKKGISHKYVNCEKEQCSGIKAFPQMTRTSDGETIRGYNEV